MQKYLKKKEVGSVLGQSETYPACRVTFQALSVSFSPAVEMAIIPHPQCESERKREH